MFKADI